MLSSLTIAIPAYNEKESLAAVVADCVRVGKTVTKNLEVLIVDDGSTDGTSVLSDSLAKKYSSVVRVFHHHKNKGFSGSIRSCYRESVHDWVFLAPADGQVNMDDMSEFFEKAPKYDLLIGYRTSNPEPLARKINSFCFHTLYRFLFGVPVKQISTVIMWRKSFLHSLPISAEDRSALIEPEVVYQAYAHKARVAQLGIPYYARVKGVAKGSDPRMILATIKELFRLWFSVRIQKEK